MPKLLVWTVRLMLLILTPVFIFCMGFVRAVLWLDGWAADQLHGGGAHAAATQPAEPAADKQRSPNIVELKPASRA